MKKIFLVFVLTACFVGCEYPESDITNVLVDVTSTADKPTRTVTLQAHVTNPDNRPVTEYGFCYAGYSSVSRPIVGLDKKIVSETNFVWNVSEEMRSSVAYVRAYIIVDGIAIYSERTVDMGLLYANVDM